MVYLNFVIRKEGLLKKKTMRDIRKIATIKYFSMVGILGN